MKVLVVEDNAVDRKLAGMVLTTGGHVVTETTSAEAAIEAVANDHYDVILLDLHLPGADGVTLIRLLKANPDTDRIPIVAVTAYSDKYPRNDLLEAGCDGWIVKPIDTRRLAREIEDAAGRKAR
jgi:CheY-like chemotaxis protein